MNIYRIKIPPWQICLAWIAGLFAVVNAVVINVIPLEKVRFSLWIYVFPLVNTLSCIVSLNAALRERITRRKVAWIFMSAASFFAVYQFIFRTLLLYNDDYIEMSILLFLISGLAFYFPKRIWSIGNTWRVAFDSLVLAISIVSLLQTGIYYFFGVNGSSLRATSYAVWIGFEIAALIGTCFLWMRYKRNILGLTVISALCILLADITGALRSWYPGIYQFTGLPDISFNFLQAMCLMLFAYYSVDKFPDVQEVNIKMLSAWEWFYWNGFPRILFTASVSAAFFVHSPDEWVVAALVFVFVIQGSVALSEEYGLLTRITAVNLELQRRQQVEADLAAERARTAMARDIHDNLGGHLHAATILASTLAEDLAEYQLPQRAQQILALLHTSVVQAHQEMRRGITVLNPAERPAGSAKLLEQTLAGPVADAQAYGLPVKMDVRGEARPVPASTADELALVVREALTNALKYAQASEVRVTVDYTDSGALVLVVADNGVGMHVPAGARPIGTGNGMGNIRARVEALGGVLDLPEVEQGVTLWIRIQGI